jgi:hypothetical protein
MLSVMSLSLFKASFFHFSCVSVIYETTGIVALYNGDVTKSDTNMPEGLYDEMRDKFRKGAGTRPWK